MLTTKNQFYINTLKKILNNGIYLSLFCNLSIGIHYSYYNFFQHFFKLLRISKNKIRRVFDFCLKNNQDNFGSGFVL